MKRGYTRSIDMKDANALIYVVEDDEGIQEVYEGAFEDEYLVKIFSSGK